MQTIYGIQPDSGVSRSSVVTIGNFDGVHIGHRDLLKQVVKRARQENCEAVVVTFEPHPVQILHPQRLLKKLFPFADLQKQLHDLGIDRLVVQTFSLEFARLPAKSFIVDRLLTSFALKHLVVGYDFSFGADRMGSLELLKQLSSQFGFSLEIVPPTTLLGEAVSSRRIRSAVQSGDIELAQQMLGRPFCMTGHVIHGDGRGHKIGFPTANVFPETETLPANGVYATQLVESDHKFISVTNIGFAPTLADRVEPLVETHVIGATQSFYDKVVRVEFFKRLRSEQKFSTVEELKKAIETDISMTKKYFNEAKK